MKWRPHLGISLQCSVSGKLKCLYYPVYGVIYYKRSLYIPLKEEDIVSWPVGFHCTITSSWFDCPDRTSPIRSYLPIQRKTHKNQSINLLMLLRIQEQRHSDKKSNTLDFYCFPFISVSIMLTVKTLLEALVALFQDHFRDLFSSIQCCLHFFHRLCSSHSSFLDVMYFRSWLWFTSGSSVSHNKCQKQEEKGFVYMIQHSSFYQLNLVRKLHLWKPTESLNLTNNAEYHVSVTVSFPVGARERNLHLCCSCEVQFWVKW